MYSYAVLPSKTLRVKVDNLSIELRGNDSKILTGLSIESETNSSPTDYYFQITQLKSEAALLELNEMFFKEQYDKLAYLEFLGSLWFGIESINMDKLDIEWNPGTNDVDRSTYKTTIIRKPQMLFTSIMDNKNIAYIFHKKDELEVMTVPLAFYRTGTNEYRHKNYVGAFINFYMMLEGLYGSGKTKNRAVLEQFKLSDELKNAVTATIKPLGDAIKNKQINDCLSTYGKRRMVDDVLEFFVSCRGNLSHFSLKKQKGQATPLNTRNYGIEAFIIMVVCMQSYNLIHKRLTSDDLVFELREYRPQEKLLSRIEVEPATTET